MSAERPDAAKILLTGRPILVDGKYHCGMIAGTSLTVDQLVRAPQHGYVAAIGGDIHNYQRYPVTLPDGRHMQYIVAGGGGAFMHATHKIPKIDGRAGLAAVLPQEMREAVRLSEYETHFFPARAWSLYWYAKLLWPGHRQLLGLSHAEAAALVGEELGLEPLDPAGRAMRQRYRRERLPFRLRAVRTLLYRRSPGPGKLFQRFLSEIIDWDDPPMAKSFLRIDATETQLRIRCFQATGWLHDEITPPLEDEVTIPIG